MNPVQKLPIIFRIQVGYFVIYSSICTLAISKMKLLFLSNPLATVSPFIDARYLLGPRNSAWTHSCGAISICGLHDSDHANLPNASPLSAWFNRLLMRDFGYLSEKGLCCANCCFCFCWFKSMLCISNWGFTFLITDSNLLHQELQPSWCSAIRACTGSSHTHLRLGGGIWVSKPPAACFRNLCPVLHFCLILVCFVCVYSPILSLALHLFTHIFIAENWLVFYLAKIEIKSW